MGGWLVAFVLLAQWAPAADTSSWRGIASLTSKPSACPGPDSADVWSRARAPFLQRYCVALARGYSLLGAHQPSRAVAQAEQADAILPGLAAPAILTARADAQLGKYAEAWSRFGAAERLRDFRLESAEALHDYARSALMGGELRVAARSYRTLLTRVDLLADRRRALEAYLEAALVVMKEGPESLPEVLADLNEARRRNDSTRFPNTLAALGVLVEARAGQLAPAPESFATPDDRGLERELAGTGDAALVLTPVDREALIAVSLGPVDPAAARKKWAEVLALSERERSPWVPDIRARLGHR